MTYPNVQAYLPDAVNPSHYSRINVYSTLNDWMDYDFIVPDHQRDLAMAILQRAFDEWHETDPCIPMYEALCDALDEYAITYSSRINDAADE